MVLLFLVVMGVIAIIIVKVREYDFLTKGLIQNRHPLLLYL